MAKGKSANPADAYRKALRKKELKKNKAERVKARDFAVVKKDTRDLEDDIAKLESTSELSSSDQARLKDLKAELEKVTKKKEEYVQEHPEHRKLVFRSRRPAESRDEKQTEANAPMKRNLFKKNGLPRHPERSIYYDPVMNPYGVPPPGMPYVERALLPHEIDSEAEEDADDEIAMPEGPPPVVEDDSDESDDIPMPEGPPPSQPASRQDPPAVVPFPSTMTMPPLPPPLPGMPPPLPSSVPSMPLMSPLDGPLLPPPPPPPGFPIIPMMPPLPPGFPISGIPPPPPRFPPFPPSHMQPPMPMPMPPPGFYPRRGPMAGTVQDPLSSVPHQTYQAHRAARASGPSTLPHNPSLPVKPTSGGVRLSTAGSPPSPHASAVISAEPELRDFKKESTAFVPAALKRKRPGGASSRVNAAPTVGPAEDKDEEEVAPVVRPDLLSTLHDKIGASLAKKMKVETREEGPVKRKDDYDKFLEEMGDILGPT